MTNSVKRYMVFAYDEYCPGGGWQDFKASFDDKEEADAHAKTLVTTGVPEEPHGNPYSYDYAEVVDSHDSEMWGTFCSIDYIGEEQSKTGLIEQAAELHHLPVTKMPAVRSEPSEFRGVPTISDDPDTLGLRSYFRQMVELPDCEYIHGLPMRKRDKDE